MQLVTFSVYALWGVPPIVFRVFVVVVVVLLAAIFTKVILMLADYDRRMKRPGKTLQQIIVAREAPERLIFGLLCTFLAAAEYIIGGEVARTTVILLLIGLAYLGLGVDSLRKASKQLRHVPPLELVRDKATGRLIPFSEWEKAHPLTAEQREQNRLELLKEFLPEEYEKEMKNAKPG